MATTKGSGHNRSERQTFLFDIGPPTAAESLIKRPKYPIWTENKAVLIERYLRYFVYVTKHGIYIDCFTGPQEPDKLETWAAKRVIESEPRLIRHFVLCEFDEDKIPFIRSMVESQPPRQRKESKRTYDIYQGDCNAIIPKILKSGKLSPKQATFCLLDQHTFECQWSTVRSLAAHRTERFKIEQFYFLANWWFERAASASTTAQGRQRVKRWWGRDDWEQATTWSREVRLEVLCDRFRKELGYASVKYWPIYGREDGVQVMYYMIHATDHPVAPVLMARAYERAVRPPEPQEQLDLELGNLTWLPGGKGSE